MNPKLITVSPADREIVDRIIKVVTTHYDVTLEQLRGPSRKKIYCVPRHVCAYLMRGLTRMTFTDIGAYFNRNHSTVLASQRYIGRRGQHDLAFGGLVRRWRAELRLPPSVEKKPATCSECGRVLHSESAL